MRHANIEDAQKLASKFKVKRTAEEMSKDVHEANLYYKIDSPRSLLETWYEELGEKVRS